MKSYTFHVAEMHCASCTVLTELELAQHPEVSGVTAKLSEKTVEVSGDFGEKTPSDVAAELSERMQPFGYTVTLMETPAQARTPFPVLALPIAALIIAGFLVLQNLGLANALSSNGTPSSTTALLIGFIASLSSCGAVVGGLALSLTAHYAHTGERILPQLSFHLGRLISFFVLGGLLGALGTMVTLGFYGTLILHAIVGIMMLALGLNLLSITGTNILKLPAFVTVPMRHITTARTPLAPFLLGALTFFLPCGFTQSAQFYTLTLGSFQAGALFMSMFALGTLPVLLIISFAPLAFRSIEKKAIFNAAAGVLVLFFGLYTLYTVLTTLL